MNLEAAITERIEALESIIDHLRDNGQSRLEYYQEKCDIYRHILADHVKDRQHTVENRLH
jgi:hypothetical protein